MFTMACVAVLGLGWPGIGAQVPLEPGSGPGSDLGCCVLVDGEAYVAFCKAWAADDPEGLAEIVNRKRGAFLPRGTKVRVLEYHQGFEPIGAEVRVLEGRWKGRRIWMPAYYLLAPDPPR